MPTGRHIHPSPGMRCVRMAAVVLIALATASAQTAFGAPVSRSHGTAVAPDGHLAGLGWTWPVPEFRLARPFVAPPHEYGAGHRGIDLEIIGTATVRSPADGVVAFAGSVAGRGILTIDHGGGLVTTLEPVSTELSPGTAVGRAEGVAKLGRGGHASAGHLHFGVRLNGDYINPMLLLGGVPRAVLLPCCG